MQDENGRFSGARLRGTPAVPDGGHAADLRASQRQRHRVLTARAELRATDAVGGDLLGQPRVRDDGEAEADEVRRLVREGAERAELLAARGGAERLDQRRAEAL